MGLEIKPITFRQASNFINQYHRHHKATIGCKFSIGCFDGEKMVGCAVCGRPVSRYYDDGLTCEINRVCTDGTYNACSILYDGEGNPQGMVQNDADLKYGVFQEVYTKEEGKDATTTAKSMFKGVEKTFTLECVDFTGAITGAGAIVKDSSTGLSGEVWIDADTHTYQNGVGTIVFSLWRLLSGCS